MDATIIPLEYTINAGEIRHGHDKDAAHSEPVPAVFLQVKDRGAQVGIILDVRLAEKMIESLQTVVSSLNSSLVVPKGQMQVDDELARHRKVAKMRTGDLDPSA